MRQSKTMSGIAKSGLQWLWVALLLIVVDRYTKIWVTHHLVFQEPVKFLPFLDFTLAYNTGAAFSFLDRASGWQNWLFGLLAAGVSLFIFFWLAKIKAKDRWLAIALCLILGGAIGNVWDRMLYHYVIDFLAFHLENWRFAVFNVADAGISVGAFMLLIHWIRE